MSPEYPGRQQSSLDNYPKLQTPIKDELDLIYHNQINNTDSLKTQPEFIVKPGDIENLYHIGNNITEARLHHLGSQPETRNNLFSNVTKKLFNKGIITTENIELLTEDQLIQKEAVIGASIFGLTEPNEHRKFFYCGLNGWVFNQTKINSNEKLCSVSFHYDVRPNGIYRVSSRSNLENGYIQDIEYNRFLSATEIYHNLVMNKLYSDRQ